MALRAGPALAAEGAGDSPFKQPIGWVFRWIQFLVVFGGAGGLHVCPGLIDMHIHSFGGDFAPSWPVPQQTIQDGSTMKVHVLPTRRPRR